MAEVGNPTIVATLTVVAALLPMLFVSGLMGPYMSPIPANASAAMIFSFFVAVIITPWLMVKIAGRADLHDHQGDDTHGGHHGGWLGRVYAAVARPVLASKGRSLGFLLLTAALSFGSLAALYTRDVTVKLLPFDNKSELSVVIDLPEGASIEATDRVARDVADVALDLPRGDFGPDLCRDARALQLQRPCAALLPAVRAAAGRSGDQPDPQGRPRPGEP